MTKVLNFCKNQGKKDIILKRNHTAIRMCIVCKQRFEQKKLFRFWLENGAAILNSKKGRSLYMCENCLKTNDFKTKKKTLARYGVKNSEQELKEMFLNG